MANYHLILLLSVAFAIVCSYAVELQEIKPWGLQPFKTRDLQRRDMVAFDLRPVETFLWGAESGSDVVLGNLTVMMPGEAENILSMERFRGMLKSVKCEPTKLMLTFNDDQTFEYAKRVWDWVNGADNHTFIMVASKGDCGDNAFRVPYKVYSLHFDEIGNLATLNATVGTWKDLAHTYEMRVGSISNSDAKSPVVARRGISESASTSIDLGVDLQYKGKISIGSMIGEVQCNPCSMAGKLNFELVVKQKNFIQIEAKFKAKPQGVKVRAAIAVTVGTDFGSKVKPGPNSKYPMTISTIQLPNYPLPGGISIHNVFSFGPQLVTKLSWEATIVEASLQVKTGATATISDSAILEADLFNPFDNNFSGWVPTVKFDPLDVKARISGKFQVYLAPAIMFTAEVIGKGVDAGISLKAPYIEVRVDAIAAPDGGACKPGDGKEFGLKGYPSYGVEVKFKAGKYNGNGVDISLAQLNFGWPGPKEICWAWDDPTVKPSTSVPALAASSNTPPANSSPASGTNTCTVRGKSGTCIDKSLCTNGGKVSTPGYCPKDPNNVQCCTADDSAPSGGKSCSVNKKAGTCMEKSVCTSGGKVATPGYCPQDPANIQCCTAKDPPVAAPKGKACTVKKGQSGTCMDKDVCMAGGKVATAGFCPGTPNEVQCCTDYPGYNSCTVKSKAGTCLPTSYCKYSKGVSTPGYCKGDPNDVQCCTGIPSSKPASGGKNIPARRLK